MDSPRLASFWAILWLSLLSASPAPVRAAEQSQRWAVLIGVNDYDEIEDLRFCSKDMLALQERLVASGFPSDHVFLLGDEVRERKYLPSKTNIERQLELVLGLAGQNDLVLIAFSGHGVHLDGATYLCPAEARLDDPARTLVALDDVYDQLQKCPAALKLLLVDACRNDPRPRGARGVGSEEVAPTFARPPDGILLLTSCSEGEISWEDEELGHGVFMASVLRGLTGEADQNQSGSVSLMELFEFAHLETKTFVARKRSRWQRPKLKGEINGIFEIGAAVAGPFSGRRAGMKKVLLARYGGDEKTEAAVERGLAWLARNQGKDGLWSLKGAYADGSTVDADEGVAATAMALLAFHGAGYTHQSGAYELVVAAAGESLLKAQEPDGGFRGEGQGSLIYAHALASIAVCEAYGMTQDSKFKAPAEKAVHYLVQTQGKTGGWRYAPKVDGDTSVTGWCIAALHTARAAGLDVPESTLTNVGSFLDSVQTEEGSRYRYQPQYPSPTSAMTAEALLGRLYLGWPLDDPRLSSGVEYLHGAPIDWEDRDVYAWYHVTQLMRRRGGDDWERWNKRLCEVLPANQTLSGAEAGSWDSEGDQWGPHGGRLMVTAFCICMLEEYYRSVPLDLHAGR